MPTGVLAATEAPDTAEFIEGLVAVLATSEAADTGAFAGTVALIVQLAATENPDRADLQGYLVTGAQDSTQAGYLEPTTLTAEAGDPFDNFMQEVVSGITGIDPTLVRPRWQPQPPVTPAVGVNWCAIGVTSVIADWNPWVWHVDDPNGGYDVLRRHERVSLLASFYGPQSEMYAGWLRDGLFIDQNLAVFRANAVGLIEVDDIVRTAELFREQFRQRSDLNVILKREVRRNYQVKSLLRAMGTIIGNAPWGSTRTVTKEFDTDNVVEP